MDTQLLLENLRYFSKCPSLGSKIFRAPFCIRTPSTSVCVWSLFTLVYNLNNYGCSFLHFNTVYYNLFGSLPVTSHVTYKGENETGEWTLKYRQAFFLNEKSQKVVFAAFTLLPSCTQHYIRFCCFFTRSITYMRKRTEGQDLSN